MFINPTVNLQVLGKPNITLDILMPQHPVYLVVEYRISSQIKDGFWRHLVRLYPLGVGIITLDIFSSNRFSIHPYERPNFATNDNPDIQSTIKFHYKLAEVGTEPGNITVTKLKLKIGRKAERSFVHTYTLKPSEQIFRWGYN